MVFQSKSYPCGNDQKDTGKEAQQTSGGDFKEFDVMTDFKDNAFNFFTTPLLLMAGDKSGSNAMTIGWGAAGTLWGRPTITVYVASGRHTSQFMEKTKYLTVMKMDDQVLDILWAGNGMNKYGKRTAPSAMNAQDSDLYVCKADGTWKSL